jgi:5'-phosphate synthase pdxT subunit
MIIGVLAVQGSFHEHKGVLKDLVEEVRLVRTPEELKGISGLVIPGGESTTIGEFLIKKGISKELEAGIPIFGTCAGLIVLARKLAGKQKNGQGLLKRLDIEVERNAYGRQRESFEGEVSLKWDDTPFPGLFIRAPRIAKFSPDVKILAWLNNAPVMVKQGNVLACAFHPELTSDVRIHQYFIENIIEE